MTKLLSYATALAVMAGLAACGSGGELVWERYFGGLASADVTEQACLSTAGQYRLEFGRTHFRDSTVTLSHVAEIAPGVRNTWIDAVLIDVVKSTCIFAITCSVFSWLSSCAMFSYFVDQRD